MEGVNETTKTGWSRGDAALVMLMMMMMMVQGLTVNECSGQYTHMRTQRISRRPKKKEEESLVGIICIP